MWPCEQNVCLWNGILSYTTDSILCLGVTTLYGTPFGLSKRNCGLAIRTTPKKLHTNVLLMAISARWQGRLTSRKHFPERKGLFEKYCPQEPSENRCDECQHGGIRQGQVL